MTGFYMKDNTGQKLDNLVLLLTLNRYLLLFSPHIRLKILHCLSNYQLDHTNLFSHMQEKLRRNK